ncbi:Gfo/Idh/MocA family oxidoreductase [Gordonia sp. CPCC 206044]
MTDRPLRIGVLGASRIAEDAIVGPARTLGHRLVAVAARDRGRAEAFAARFGVERVLGSYQDVIDDPEVDVVYNPLANALHGPWNLAAVRAGKPVLSEKPFARNVIEAQEVADAARTAGVVVLEGFHHLFHPLMGRIRDLLDADTVGEIRQIEVVMAMPSPGVDDPRWSYDLAGGALMDLGCYGLHMSRTLGRWCGGPPEITGGSARLRGPQIDESAVIHVRFPNGATGVLANSMIGTGSGGPGAGSEASGPNPHGAGSEASGPNPHGAGSEASGPNPHGAGSEASGPNPHGAGSEASGPNPHGAGSEASGPNLHGAGSEASGPEPHGAEYVFGLRVVGDSGSLFAHDFLGPNRDDRLTIVDAARGTVSVEHLGTRSTYTYQLEAFANAVLRGAPLPIDLDDAVENMRYLDTAYKAIGLDPR